MRMFAVALAMLTLSPVQAADPAPGTSPAQPPAQPATQTPGDAAKPAVPAVPPPLRCTLTKHAALDMAMDETGRITVPISINGNAKQMMVDTGTPNSLVTAQTVGELKLKYGFAGGGHYIVGVGGDLSIFTAHIDEFGLGNMKLNNFNLFVELEWMESAGLLGADFLAQFDVDLDFAHAKLNLMRQQNCAEGEAVYWSEKPYGIIPFDFEENHIKVAVNLDGKPITAWLDTGAADTIMSLDKASDAFKLDEDKLKKTRHYPFQSLTVGEVRIGNPAIELVTDKESGLLGHRSDDLHMIIGMGVLRRLHMYISYKDKKIYVTPATQY